MKTRISLFVSICFLLCCASAWCAPATIEGQIQGYNCVAQGKPCPVGKEDPVIATEETFVLLTSTGYYFVPNVNMKIMARHITQEARVIGDVDPKYNAIRAQTLEVKQNGQWKVVWTPTWWYQEHQQ